MRATLHWAALVTLVSASSPALAAPAPFDCDKLPCAELLPGAVSFQPSAGAPYLTGLDPEGAKVGWLILSTDAVETKGYSGQPLVTLVALGLDGKIAGARVVEHHEPILLVGIDEQELHDFVDFYRGKPADAKVVVGDSPDPDALTVDVISGATVTALAQNQTVLQTAVSLGRAVGLLEEGEGARGHFVESAEVWSWERMQAEGVFGRLTVQGEQMGPRESGTFIDLWFTLADPPQVGRALLGERTYEHLMESKAEGQHLLVIYGSGSSSFKGSGFVRGGLFDRVRVEQGLQTLLFRDTDYTPLNQPQVEGAPRFKEGAVFRTQPGLAPGAAFDLVFIGSVYNYEGGFSRNFKAFSATHQLPASMYFRPAPPKDESPAIWEQAWYNQRYTVAILGAILLAVLLLFAGRRWTTGNMSRLHRLHITVMALSVGVLGFWLHAQPSVTQVLTLLDGAAGGQMSLALFLSEPLLFVFWCFIAVVTLVWGRGVFCGWLCPYGAMTELGFKLREKLGLPGGYELPERIHTKLRYLRYLILVGLVTVFLVDPAVGEQAAEVEPFKSTFFVAPWTREWYFLGWWVALLALSLVMWRPFCRYLCPLGAALAIPGSARVSGPYRREFCNSCQICTKGCEPRAIRKDGSIDPRECLSCMECEANYRDDEVCPPLVALNRLRLSAARKGVEPDPKKVARQEANLVKVGNFSRPGAKRDKREAS